MFFICKLQDRNFFFVLISATCVFTFSLPFCNDFIPFSRQKNEIHFVNVFSRSFFVCIFLAKAKKGIVINLGKHQKIHEKGQHLPHKLHNDLKWKVYVWMYALLYLLDVLGSVSYCIWNIKTKTDINSQLFLWIFHKKIKTKHEMKSVVAAVGAAHWKWHHILRSREKEIKNRPNGN
jgi:hypothetical protein